MVLTAQGVDFQKSTAQGNKSQRPPSLRRDKDCKFQRGSSAFREELLASDSNHHNDTSKPLREGSASKQVLALTRLSQNQLNQTNKTNRNQMKQFYQQPPSCLPSGPAQALSRRSAAIPVALNQKFALFQSSLRRPRRHAQLQLS
jgi:hypothetical protein